MNSATRNIAAAQPGGPGPWMPLHTLRRGGLGGLIHGDGYTDEVEGQLRRHMTVQLPRPVRIGVVSLKGGVGKSATALGVAATLAQARGTHTALIDTDTDAATAGIQVGGGGTHSWWDLLSAAAKDEAAARRDPARFATQLPNIGLHIYPAPVSAELRARMIGRQYASLLRVLGYRYWVSIIDCGTGLTGNIAQEVLRSSDAIIIATSVAEADLIKAVETRQFLARNGHARLAAAATVAAWIRPGSGKTRAPDVEDMLREKWFTPLGPQGGGDAQVREVIAVPNDDSVAGGASINPTAAAPRTQAAWRAVGAAAMSAVCERLAAL